MSSVEVSTSEEEDSSDDDNSSVSSDDNSSEEESDAAAQLNAKKEEAARKAREAKAADLNWTPSKNKDVVVEVKTECGSDGAQVLSVGKLFQCVDDQFWGTKEGKYEATTTGVQQSSRLLSMKDAPGLLLLPQGVPGGKMKALKGEGYILLLLKDDPFHRVCVRLAALE